MAPYHPFQAFTILDTLQTYKVIQLCCRTSVCSRASVSRGGDKGEAALHNRHLWVHQAKLGSMN